MTSRRIWFFQHRSFSACVAPTKLSETLHRRRRGQSLVELAIALPMLLLLMLGTLDLGRMFFDYIQLRNAVREGAAYGARAPDDTTGIRDRVDSHLDNYLREGDDTTIPDPETTGSCATIGGECLITVRATRTFRPIMTGFFQQYGMGTVSLGVSASARVMS